MRIGVVHDGDHFGMPCCLACLATEVRAGVSRGQGKQQHVHVVLFPEIRPTRFQEEGEMLKGWLAAASAMVCQARCLARNKNAGYWTMSRNALRDLLCLARPIASLNCAMPRGREEGGNDADAHGCNLGQRRRGNYLRA